MLNRKKILFFVNISKISILVMMSIFLIGFFFPYYDYPNDAHVYGIQSIRMANGEYEFQNDLLKNSGLWEFTPHSWLKTSENFAVPDILPGLPAIGAFFYSITGNWGLFYFGPIITIVFLILCERISSKFFGPYVGLLTLVFLSTNEMVFWVGRGLLTSSIFSVIFILGVYFLIKFFNNNNSKYLLLTSICFTSITFIRLNGIILLPIEIIAVSGFFIINYYRNKNKNISTENSSLKITSNLLSLKKNSFIISSLIIPWLFFFLFFFSFNAHYFDDPLITIYNVPDNPRKAVDERGFDALQIDDERTKLYFKHFLPYPINRIGDTSTYSENYASEDILASNFLFMFNNDSDINFNNLGILSMFILISGFVFANYRKKNTIEINTFLIFLTGIILFYSTDFISISRQGSARDVLPILPFFYMILSYLLLKLISRKNIHNWKDEFLKISKVFIIISLIIFIPTSYYFADYSQILKQKDWEFTNPINIQNDFPRELDVDKNGIILTGFNIHWVLGYGANPFSPVGYGNGFGLENKVYQHTIEVLRTTINEEHDVYLFKEAPIPREIALKNDLVNNQGFVLIDYSTEFCKLHLKNDNIKTDENCLN